jgi:hypothetical protein
MRWDDDKMETSKEHGEESHRGTTKCIGFLDVTSCSLEKVYVRFGDGRFLLILGKCIPNYAASHAWKRYSKWLHIQVATQDVKPALNEVIHSLPQPMAVRSQIQHTTPSSGYCHPFVIFSPTYSHSTVVLLNISLVFTSPNHKNRTIGPFPLCSILKTEKLHKHHITLSPCKRQWKSAILV